MDIRYHSKLRNTSEFFEQFLADRGLTLLRMERVDGTRSKVIVQHEGRDLSVSYSGTLPTRCALQKLDYAIGERSL